MILFSKLLEIRPDTKPPKNRAEPCSLIDVPRHIWDALAMRSGMAYQLVLYTNLTGVLLNEIACTAHRAEEWPNLWRLRIAFRDDPGLLAKLTDLLSEARLNIVSCRAETTEPDAIGRFEFLLDASGYSPRPHEPAHRFGESLSESLPEVRAQIVSRFARHIVFHKHDALFSLRRVPQLVIAAETVRQDPLHHDTTKLTRGCLPIPVRYLEEIRRAVSAVHPETVFGLSDVRAAMRADTDAGVVRVMFLFPGRHIVFSISHPDVRGALAAISRTLSNKGLNMLQLRSEAVAEGKRVNTDVIVAPALKQRVVAEEISIAIEGCLDDCVCTPLWPVA